MRLIAGVRRVAVKGDGHLAIRARDGWRPAPNCGIMLAMSAGSGQRSELRLPLNEAKAQLETQIKAGRELLDTEFLSLPAQKPEAEPAAEVGLVTGLMLRGINRGIARLNGPTPSMDALKYRIDEWLAYNVAWLELKYWRRNR